MINFISPPVDYFDATPAVVIDIYNGVSGGKTATITNGQLGVIRVEVTKNIRDARGGSFRILLAPGGPDGVDSEHTWTSIITPYSLAVIAMKRGMSSSIVMIGIITNIREAQEWRTESGVSRVIEIVGLDFSIYFSVFAYYVLKFLGILNTLPELLGPAGTVGNTAINYPTAISDTAPDKVGTYWFNNVVMGTDAGDASQHGGILSQTFINYAGSSQKVRQFFGNFIEPYDDELNLNMVIPMSIDFLVSDGDIFSKFAMLFPFPFYELFVITAPSLVQNTTIYPPGISPLISIQSSDSSILPASPYLIARVNPLPWARYTAGTAGVTVHNAATLVSKRWNNLPTYDFSVTPFIASDVAYTTDEIRNFYVVSPMSPLTMTGNSLSTIQGAIEQFGFMIDPYSMSRFGFRPEICTIGWWTDAYNLAGTPTGNASQPGPEQWADMLSKVASYYEPTPNMLSGTVQMALWPDVFPGTRFRYKPFKDSSDNYLFYIEAVTHVYEFGSQSSTTINITRGLTERDYSDETLLLYLHTGNADRVDGQLTENPKGTFGLFYSNLGDVDITVGPFSYTTPKSA